MNKSKVTDTQIMAALKTRKSGVSRPDICPEMSFSSATYYYKPRKRIVRDKPDASDY
jgi:hypothetical protein